MTTNNATDKQLELGFNADSQCQGADGTRRKGRIARAGWWFAQMREAVANAMDWQNAEPRPKQIWIPGTAREVKV